MLRDGPYTSLAPGTMRPRRISGGIAARLPGNASTIGSQAVTLTSPSPTFFEFHAPPHHTCWYRHLWRSVACLVCRVSGTAKCCSFSISFSQSCSISSTKRRMDSGYLDLLPAAVARFIGASAALWRVSLAAREAPVVHVACTSQAASPRLAHSTQGKRAQTKAEKEQTKTTERERENRDRETETQRDREKERERTGQQTE